MVSYFSDPIVSDQITHFEEWPAREATFAELPSWLDTRLLSNLRSQGVDRLFSHQAEALEQWRLGKDVVVTTGTNSGKTLCYGLPTMQLGLMEPAARCLYLFPTKALAQDQMRRLRDLRPDDNLRIDAYDGDTPKSQRASIRQNVNVLITNPDMLHLGILPGHEGWSRFFRALRLVAIDEMHVYRGVFGSHAGCVLRRLLRICESYGAAPQIVCCTATIGNAQEVFEKLTGRKAQIVSKDGSPRGRRSFVFWNPPQLDPDRRMSANVVASEIMSDLVEAQQRTLVFSRSRVGAELVLKYAQKRLGQGASCKVDSYRAGYTPKERRQIEKSLFDGKLLGLSATNAMELGVDVGLLDAVVLNGYPGTISSFWQQAGRAGRGTRDGIAIMVAHDDPLEQFLARRPEMILSAGNENVALNPNNARVLAAHLLCAAYEKPIGVSEMTTLGDDALVVAEALDRQGDLQFQGGRFFFPGYSSPATEVNIRGAGADEVELRVDGIELGRMELWRAMMQAHTGAVYLHRGGTYLVEELDISERTARLLPAEVSYYTQAVVQSVLDASPASRRKSSATLEASLCQVTVTDAVTEFRRKSLDGDTVLGSEPLDLPPQTYETVAVRFDLPPVDLDNNLADAIAAVHGAEHALLALAPLIAGCDRSDLGSVWYPTYPESMRPAIFVFDRTPGGVGLAERLYDSLGGWVKSALQLLLSCSCAEGCPACLLSPRCECANESLDKSAAVNLLTQMC